MLIQMLHWLTILDTCLSYRMQDVTLAGWGFTRPMESHTWFPLWRAHVGYHWLASKLHLNTLVIENEDVHLFEYICANFIAEAKRGRDMYGWPTNRYKLKTKSLPRLEKCNIYLLFAKTLSTLHSLPSSWMLLITQSQRDGLWNSLLVSPLFKPRECHWLQRGSSTAQTPLFSNLKKDVTCYAYALSPKCLHFLKRPGANISPSCHPLHTVCFPRHSKVKGSNYLTYQVCQ